MSQQLDELWGKTLKLIQTEVTDVSYSTWFEPLTPLRMENNQLKLGTNNDFAKKILEDRYRHLIENAFNKISDQSCEVIISLSTEDDSSDERIPQEEKLISNNTLNPKYTFDKFVIGNSNRFAHAASLAVAEAPAQAYNPLFIYGGVGLGKTHLMHAIGHFILKQNPNMTVYYVSSEEFTNELINAIQHDKNEEFRNKYRNVDVLLVDDVQFIAGKERTQEEFFHTFNALHHADKQIILSSDRPPKEIPKLEERIRSRFEWGLIADIQAPDLETRIAILRKRAEQDKLKVDPSVLNFIANHVHSNIRELEGALTRVVAYSSLTNREMTAELAEEALRDMISKKAAKKIDTNEIKSVVSSYYHMRMEDFNSKKRSRAIAFPRQIAMYLVRDLTDLSLPKIGEEFGGRDHTTVIHACDKIAQLIKDDQSFRSEIETLTEKIKTP